MDNVDIGFMACRELVPDVWDLADYVDDAMAELLAAAEGLETEAPGTKPAAKRAPAKKASKTSPAKKAAAKPPAEPAPGSGA
jgi:topoisomerase IA-like protein